MSEAQNSKKPTPWRRYAIIAGIVLALICKSVPKDYQSICETLASICTMGN